MVDDSHATGFIGEQGRGTHEYCDVMGRVDIITSTLGKGLGGASGGFVSASKNIVSILKQKARPYLFSNSVAPVIAATSVKVLDLVTQNNDLRVKLKNNSKRFREGLEAAGFDLTPGEHPIIPVMLYDEKLAAKLAEKLLDYGIYVIAFSYPVVPKGLARIRTQMSAGHTFEQIDKAIEAFKCVGREIGVI
jgi:glycine C-acetyltransferase